MKNSQKFTVTMAVETANGFDDYHVSTEFDRLSAERVCDNHRDSGDKYVRFYINKKSYRTKKQRKMD